MKLQKSTVLVTGAIGKTGPSVTESLVDRDADFSERTAPVVREAISLLSNESVTGRVVQMTGGRPEVAARWH